MKLKNETNLRVCLKKMGKGGKTSGFAKEKRQRRQIFRFAEEKGKGGKFSGLLKKKTKEANFQVC